MRSCRFNSLSCEQFICRLISCKFDYLLNANDAIKIDHLLRIPMINCIKINITDVPYYMYKQNQTRSRYMGIDNVSGNAFITFWILKIDLTMKWKILTFVINETNIDCVHVSSYGSLFKPHSQVYKSSDFKDMHAINALLLTGKVSSILNEAGPWCLIDQYEKCIFYVKLRERLITWYFLLILPVTCFIFGIFIYFEYKTR